MPDVAVCRIEQLREGRGREVHLGPDLTCVLFRVGEEVFAIGSECLHTGAPLADGFVRDGCVICPWHGWMYALDTGRRHSTLFGELAGHIPSYPVRVDSGGQVWVTADSLPPPPPPDRVGDDAVGPDVGDSGPR